MDETFLERETICREPPPGHVFVESLAKIDPRKVVEVVRLTRHTSRHASATHFFRALSETARFRCKRARLSLFRPQPRVPSFIQIDPSFLRVISENDLPDRYNNRQCRSEIGSPIIMMALD